MPIPGSYCKAYPADRLRAFPGWTEDAPPLRLQLPANEEPVAARTSELEYFYLHSDYAVRAGIFLDRDIVFSQVTPEWKAFCSAELGFRVPDEVAPAAENAPSTAGQSH